MKFDINKLKVKDLNGLQVMPQDVARVIGNQIYTNATTLDWDILSRDIYAGKPVELSSHQLDQLEQFLLSDHSPLKLLVKKPLKDYFITIKNQSNEQAKNSK